MVHHGSCTSKLLAVAGGHGGARGRVWAFVEVVHDQGKEEREQEGPEAPRV